LDGFHSIRINQQWRIIFRWEASSAAEVKIADYH
jgi:proteic killer suppression protein